MKAQRLFEIAEDATCPKCNGPVEVIDLDTVGECGRCRETLWRRRSRDRWQTTAKYFGVRRGVKRTGKRPKKPQTRRR